MMTTMEITINKTDFELSMPIGMSAHDTVFESILPAIEEKKAIVLDSIVGVEGMAYIDTMAQPEYVIKLLKKHICLFGFLSLFRQLDLVLTPTGFGIVNNDNLSPASKQRVDALEGALRTEYVKSKALLVNALRSKEWGDSRQAIDNIRYIYDSYHFFFCGENPALSYVDWNSTQSSIENSDLFLRKKISDKQIDFLLNIIRRNDEENLLKCKALIDAIITFTEVWASSGSLTAKGLPLQRLMRRIENDIETYSLYADSVSYKANHNENFQNTKESSAFIFNG